MGTRTNAPVANVVTVAVQHIATPQGTEAALGTVRAAVQAHNKANGLTGTKAHTAVQAQPLPNNSKGMQYQLALMAVLARQHGANVVRLGVHGGIVALCGTQAAITATQNAMTPAHNAISTAASNAYSPAVHGGRVGFVNAFTCGAPAGLQVAAGTTATLAYGIGYLYTFAPPTNGTAYALGQAMGTAHGKAATAAKAAPKAPKAPKAAPATPEAATVTPEAATGTNG